MAVQTHHLLIDADPVGIDRDFRREPSFVDGPVRQDLIDPAPEVLAVFREDHRGTLLDHGQRAAHGLKLSEDVVLQVLPFRLPRFHKVGAGLLQAGGKRLPELFLVHLTLTRGEDVREPGKHGNADIVLEPQVCCHLSAVLQVFLRQSAVVTHSAQGAGIILIGNVEIDLAAFNIRFQQGPDLRLETVEYTGHPDAEIKVSVIDGFHLNRELVFLADDFRSSETGHAFDHDCHSTSGILIRKRSESTGTRGYCLRAAWSAPHVCASG